MSDELKNCPHCGNNDYVTVGRVEGETLSPDNFQVVCSWLSGGCGASGGVRRTQAEAIAAWNARADDAPISEKPAPSLKESTDDTQVLSDSREKLEEAMRNVIRDALLNLKTAIMCCVEQGMDVLSFDEAEFVDYEPEFYVDEYLSRAMRLLDRQAAISERELCAECEWPSLAAMPDLEQEERIAEQDRRIVEYAEQVDSLTAERDKLDEDCSALDKRCIALEERVDSLTAERDELRVEVEAQRKRANYAERGALSEEWYVCRDRYEDDIAELNDELDKANETGGKLLDKLIDMTAERDYWRDEVQYCMDSAYPKSHAPERGYDQNVMAYPDRNGCTTPSTLVSAVIDQLRDAAQDGFYASRFGDLVHLTAERDRLQKVVQVQAESFQKLERELKEANDTCNTLRASVAGLRGTVEKLKGENADDK